MQPRHVLHHRRDQRVPLRARQRHPLRQRRPLFGRAQRMELPRQTVHDHPRDIPLRPAGRDPFDVPRQREPAAGSGHAPQGLIHRFLLPQMPNPFIAPTRGRRRARRLARTRPPSTAPTAGSARGRSEPQTPATPVSQRPCASSRGSLASGYRVALQPPNRSMADWPTRSVSCRSCCLISECYLPCLTKIVPTTCRRDSGLDRRNARSSCPRREHPWVLPSADARTAPSPSDAVRLPATARRGARSSRTGPAGCASVVAVACEDGASAVPRRHATRAPTPQESVEVGIALRHRMDGRARGQTGQVMLNRSNLVQQPERVHRVDHQL